MRTLAEARTAAEALRRALPGMKRRELRDLFFQVRAEAREVREAIGAEVDAGRLKSGCLLVFFFSHVDRADVVLRRRATRLDLRVAVEGEVRDWLDAAEFLANPPETSRKAVG